METGIVRHTSLLLVQRIDCGCLLFAFSLQLRSGVSSTLLPAGYLKSQDVPMVIVSHDREFLDQLCNKLVETDQGVATSYKGNYTEYVKAKEERVGQQWAAWEKQQKEISRQVAAATAHIG